METVEVATAAMMSAAPIRIATETVRQEVIVSFTDAAKPEESQLGGLLPESGGKAWELKWTGKVEFWKDILGMPHVVNHI